LYDRPIYPAKTIRWKGSSASELNDPRSAALAPGRQPEGALLLDLPNLSNNARTLFEQGNDLSIDLV
jgi:hypothetical protein